MRLRQVAFAKGRQSPWPRNLEADAVRRCQCNHRVVHPPLHPRLTIKLSRSGGASSVRKRISSNKLAAYALLKKLVEAGATPPTSLPATKWKKGETSLQAPVSRETSPGTRIVSFSFPASEAGRKACRNHRRSCGNGIPDFWFPCPQTLSAHQPPVVRNRLPPAAHSANERIRQTMPKEPGKGAESSPRKCGRTRVTAGRQAYSAAILMTGSMRFSMSSAKWHLT